MDDSYTNTCNASAVGLRVYFMFILHFVFVLNLVGFVFVLNLVDCFRLSVSKEFVKQVLLIKLTNCQKVVFAVALLYVVLKKLYS